MCLVLQGHSGEIEQLKDLIAQQDKAAATRQACVGSLQTQLAESRALVSSLNSKLGASQQSHRDAVQVLLQL